jgi:hypothetical protein
MPQLGYAAMDVGFRGVTEAWFNGLKNINEGASFFMGLGEVKGLRLAEGQIFKSGGFFRAEGSHFKFSEYYYNKLWSTGRGAPFVQAKEILATSTSKMPDRMAGFFRYVNGKMEMVYNPKTGEVWHMRPVK